MIVGKVDSTVFHLTTSFFTALAGGGEYPAFLLYERVCKGILHRGDLDQMQEGLREERGRIMRALSDEGTLHSGEGSAS